MKTRNIYSMLLFVALFIVTQELFSQNSSAGIPCGNEQIDFLKTGGYIAMIDIPAVTDGSYKHATSTTTGFVLNLSSYSLGKYEVTYELWYTVYRWAISNGYKFANKGREGSNGINGANPTEYSKLEPVTNINWRDCIVWCNAYSEMSGKTPVYYRDSSYSLVLRSSVDETNSRLIDKVAGSYDNPYMDKTSTGYRLPTNGEWMYAASCNATYPYNHASGADVEFDATTGGVDIDGDETVKYTDDVAWYSDNSSSKTHPVGQKASNMWGFYDMSGNAFEWCQDWAGTNPTSEETYFPDSIQDSIRVYRSGSFEWEANYQQVGMRFLIYPDVCGGGFRVCCSR